MKTHPGLSIEEIRNKNTDALKILTEYIKDTDMVICIENLRSDDPISYSADDLLYFINKIDSKNLGICLDTGHLNLTVKNHAEFIQKAGKHIKALHIADNTGESDQHIMPFSRGTVNIEEVISEMKKIGYDGLYNLEIPGESHCPLEIRSLKLDYIKKVFEYLDR